MKRCGDIGAGLDDWLDGRAGEDALAEINAHLAECPDCARYFDQQRRLAGDLLALGRAADRLASSADAAERTAFPARRRVPWRAAVAALLVIAAGAYLVEYRLSHPAEQRAELRPASEGPPAPEPPPFSCTIPDEYLAVQIESSNPQIHIVWLYSEVSAESPTE